MGLLSLTSEGVSFLLDEADITVVYAVNSITYLEYKKKESNTLETIVVAETLAAIDALSNDLIELTKDGVTFLLNSKEILTVVAETGGSKIVYSDVAKQDISVSETPTEINNLINTPSTEPLRYKVLIKQHEPTPTTTNPDMVEGQIWTLEAYNIADAATIASLELISGTLYAIGSKYRSATGQTLAVNAATTLSYDGSPFIVSTDVNGDFNPFVNTLGGNPVLSYHGVGTFRLTLSGAFLRDKTSVLYGYSADRNSEINVKTNDYIIIYTFNELGVLSDSLLNYTPIEIEVYP